MFVLEQSHSNSNLTETCDTNEVVEVNFQENIDDEICSTCANELNPEEDLKTIEEKCDKCEYDEKKSKADELSSENYEDQSTFQINDENNTVVEDTIENIIVTKSDELVLENNMTRINEENGLELNPIAINNDNTETLQLNISDSTESKSELNDNSNQTLLKDDQDSSFLPIKLDELQVFSISNETQSNVDEQNSINNEEINSIHTEIISVTSSGVTASSVIDDTEHVESKIDLLDVNESETIENIIEIIATSNLESTNQESSIHINGDESVKEEHTVPNTTVDDIFNKNTTVIKEEDLDKNIVDINAEVLISTEILEEASNTLIVDSNITKEIPINVSGIETQLEDNQPQIETDIKENSQTIDNSNQDYSGNIDKSKENNSKDSNIDTTNFQEKIIVESLNSTELFSDTNVKVIQENQVQSYEVNEDSASIKESFESETRDVDNKEENVLCNNSDVQEIKSNIESIENDEEKITTQDSTDSLHNVVQTFNEENQLESENSITTQNNTQAKKEENETNIVTDLVPEDNIIEEQTIENFSDDTSSSEVIIDQSIELNDTKSHDMTVKHGSGIAEVDSITELKNINEDILTTEQSVVNSNTVTPENSKMVSGQSDDTKLKSEDNTKNIEAEDSRGETHSNENINEEASVVTTLLMTEDNQLENITSFESDSTDVSNDTKLTSEDNTKNIEAEDSRGETHDIEIINEEASVVTTLLMTEDNQLENSNSFEFDSTVNLNDSTTGDSKVVGGSTDTKLTLEGNLINIEAEVSQEIPQANENVNGENHVQTRSDREENRFTNGTNNNIEVRLLILLIWNID